LNLAGGAGGHGKQGQGGQGGDGRLLVGGAMLSLAKAANATAWGRLEEENTTGAAPGFRCQPSGIIISGLVFDDKGGANAIPHDGHQQTGEEGLAGWPFKLRAGQVLLASDKTDAEGRFSLTLPETSAANGEQTKRASTLNLTVIPPSNWLVVAANQDTTSGLSYLGQGQWQLQPGSGSYFQQLRLGVVKKPDFIGPPKRQVASDSTQIFPFRYVSHTSAQVSFSAQVSLDGHADKAALLFLDPKCNGQSHFAADGKSGWFSLQAEQPFCVRLRVEVNKNETGQQLDWMLEATTHLASGVLPVAPLVQTLSASYPVH
jgi:hypothetical protein